MHDCRPANPVVVAQAAAATRKPVSSCAAHGAAHSTQHSLCCAVCAAARASGGAAAAMPCDGGHDGGGGGGGGGNDQSCRCRRRQQWRKAPKAVWLDVDCGVDDAQALALLALAARRGEVSVRGVSTVAGNVSLTQVLLNTERVMRVSVLA
jgi:hypothetical protein